MIYSDCLAIFISLNTYKHFVFQSLFNELKHLIVTHIKIRKGENTLQLLNVKSCTSYCKNWCEMIWSFERNGFKNRDYQSTSLNMKNHSNLTEVTHKINR